MEIRPAISLEYIRVATSATDEDGATVDPTADGVALAFVTEGDPVDVDTDFITGDWETDVSTPTAPIYYARVLAGPAPDSDYVPVADTSIDIYAKVTDNPEIPIRKAGTVRFT